jgi:hypothetical protein
MIDTALLQQAVCSPLPKKALESFVWRGERYSYREAGAAGENPPCLFYTPSRDGKFYLSVEASLPKLLYGHNLTVLTDAEITQALQKISDFATRQFRWVFNALTASSLISGLVLSSLFICPRAAVLDLFFGSGSTAVACLLSDRLFVGIEFIPEYVAVCLQRLETLGCEVRKMEPREDFWFPDSVGASGIDSIDDEGEDQKEVEDID